jgi:restriction endonuclease Mrr
MATAVVPVVIVHLQMRRWWVTALLSALVLIRVVLWWQRETALARQCLFSDELRTLNTLEPRVFEREMMLLLQQQGYELRQLDRGAGRGADLVGHAPDGDPVLVLCVQRGLNRKVTVSEVDRFIGAMAARGVGRGVIATTGRLHDDATVLAQARSITVIDGPLIDRQHRSVAG